jgi:hypothetical protein
MHTHKYTHMYIYRYNEDVRTVLVLEVEGEGGVRGRHREGAGHLMICIYVWLWYYIRGVRGREGLFTRRTRANQINTQPQHHALTPLSNSSSRVTVPSCGLKSTLRGFFSTP